MDITHKQKKILLWGGVGVIAVGLLLTFTPLGNLLQSNLIGTNYVTRDSGLYLGKNEALTTGTALRAETGVSLKSENALKDQKYLMVDVYAHQKSGEADTLATTFAYNPTLVSLETGFVIPTTSAVTIDETTTKVEKDSSGKETGKAYVMVRKNSPIQKPSEKLYSLRLTVKDTVKQGEVNVEIARLIDSVRATEVGADTLIVRGETQNAVGVPLVLSTTGNRIEIATTVDSTTGKKTEQQIIYNASGQKIQEIITVYLANGKKESETITYYNASTGAVTSTEVWEYSYNSDGSYTVVKTVTLADGTKTVTTYTYNAQGELQSSSENGAFNTAYTRVSQDAKVKVTMPAQAHTGDVQLSISPVSTSLVTANSNYPMVGSPYRINAYINASDKRVLTSLKPFTIAFTTAENEAANPYFFDENSNQWIKYPSTRESSTIISLKTSTFGIYALFKDGADPLRPSAGTGTTMNNNSNGSTSTGTTVTDTSVCVPSDPFVDMTGHWSVNYVEQARLKCIVGGKFAGRFAPDDFVTRAELTKMAVEAFELAQVQSTTETGFLDVRIADWFADYVATARKANVIQGYGDATYRPNAYINRAEALKIILEAQNIAKGTNRNFTTILDNWRAQFPTYTYVQFRDTPTGQWFAKYVLYAWQNDVVEGYQDASGVLFKPGQNITRAEVIKIIMEML